MRAEPLDRPVLGGEAARPGDPLVEDRPRRVERQRGGLVAHAPVESVRTSAAGIPAASAVMPSAVPQRRTGHPGQAVLGLLRRPGVAVPARGRPPTAPACPRSSGSVDSTLCSSRIAETPSTSAWWILVYIATRPSRSPSMTCPSQSGRSRASRVLCRREHSSSSSRTRPGLGSALCRTWYSMSNCSSSTQTHWPAVLDRAVRMLEEQRRDLLDVPHLLEHLADVVAAGALGLLEQLEPADVHRHAAVLGEQERRPMWGRSERPRGAFRW